MFSIHVIHTEPPRRTGDRTHAFFNGNALIPGFLKREPWYTATVVAIMAFAAGMVARRWGVKVVLIALGAALAAKLVVAERSRRKRNESESGARMGGGSGALGSGVGGSQGTPIVLVRGIDGRLLSVSRAHLALMFREGDFTGDDYDELLRLDEEGPGFSRMAASDAMIARVPACLIHSIKHSPQFGMSCAICLDEFQREDVVGTMPCMHSYHHACLATWLRIKGTCPICVAPLIQPQS